MIEYTKVLVTFYHELISNVDRLNTLLEYFYILVINRHTLKVYHPQFLSQYCRLSFMHQFILYRVVHSLRVSRAMVQEVDLQEDLVAKDLRSHLLLSRLAVGRPECLL